MDSAHIRVRPQQNETCVVSTLPRRYREWELNFKTSRSPKRSNLPSFLIRFVGGKRDNRLITCPRFVSSFLAMKFRRNRSSFSSWTPWTYRARRDGFWSLNQACHQGNLLQKILSRLEIFRIFHQQCVKKFFME